MQGDRPAHHERLDHLRLHLLDGGVRERHPEGEHGVRDEGEQDRGHRRDERPDEGHEGDEARKQAQKQRERHPQQPKRGSGRHPYKPHGDELAE